MSQEQISITVLVDNHAEEGLTEEHGLALLIRTAAGEIMFDTGKGGALFANAASLGIDLRRPETLVLSHCHHDHTGGIAALLRINPELAVYFLPGVWDRCFSRHGDGSVHEISMPAESREALRHHAPERLHPVSGPTRIAPGIHLTGAIPRIAPFEDSGGSFWFDAAGHDPNPIGDDLAMWLDTPTGLVIVLGCCHAGIVNTVEHIRASGGTGRIRGILGGLHLLHASPERLTRTVEQLRLWAPDFIIPCHCTGTDAVEFLRSQLGDIVRPGQAGMTIRI